MKRQDFFNKVTVDGIQELDFLWNNISDFDLVASQTLAISEELYEYAKKMFKTYDLYE